MKFSWHNILDIISEVFLAAIIFLIPLYFAVWFPTYNVFELDKLVLFKVIFWMLLALSIIKAIFYWPIVRCFNYLWWKQVARFIWGPLLFIGGLSALLFFYNSPSLIFSGSYYRQEGLLSYLFYFGFFVLTVLNMLNVGAKQRFEMIRRLARVALISSSLVVFYGFMQLGGFDFIIWPEPPLLTRRVFSSFGQPNFLASWLLLLFPLTLYFLFRANRLLTCFLYGLLLIGQMLILAGTLSRGAWLSFGAGLLLACLFFWPLAVKRFRRRAYFSLLIGLVSVVILAWGTNHFSYGRVVNMFDFSSGSVAARLNFWKASGPAILDRPLIGYGLENYSSVFIKAYRSDWAIFGNVNAYTDRAHNLFIDILLASGIIGLFLWLALFFYIVKLLLSNKRIYSHQAEVYYLNIALGFSLLMYLLSLLFSFSFVAGQVYFWFIMAVLLVLNYSGKKQQDSRLVEIRFGLPLRPEIKVFIMIAALALCLWRINLELKPLKADHYFNSYLNAIYDRQYFTAFVLYNYVRLERDDVHPQEIYDRLSVDLLADVYPLISEVSSQYALKQILSEAGRNLPADHYENIIAKGKAASLLGDFVVSKEYFDRAQFLAPELPRTYLERGLDFSRQKSFDYALLEYRRALSKLPDLSLSIINPDHRQAAVQYQGALFKSIGDTLSAQGQYVEAAEYYNSAYLLNPRDFTLYKKIADTYYLRHDLESAIKYVKAGLRRSPLDPAWSLALASLYREKGDLEMAARYEALAISLKK